MAEKELNKQPDLQALRHTASHIMAQAIKHLYPNTKFAIGPAIDDGFYYDIDTDVTISPDDLGAIESEMKAIIKANYPLERFVLSRADALEKMKDEPYKVELINALPEDAEISFYSQGDFTDLCAGPHVSHTGRLKANAVKLQNVTGAYWRGDSKNKMLQRIYGTAFANKEDLAEYLTKIEEAKKRDHRKLGRELGLFIMRDEGPGFPFFLPNGMILKNQLLNYWREIHYAAGYKEISTPIMLTKSLWERSGHAEKYADNMYTTVIDEEDFCIKPMNCPGGMLVYQSEPHSYRELPLRVAELGIVHRHELSGTLHGLMRVRVFTQDDAHIFMTEEQVISEIRGVIDLIDGVYSKFGFKYHIELSTMPENHIGDLELWETATEKLKTALTEAGKDFVINEGDGAFYGPKIDFHLEDSLGRTWQCGTIQLDYQMPQRFELEYTGPDGEKHRPVMIHRVALGSVERFIGILIEHYAGAFPLWLAPLQVKVLPITDRVSDYADVVCEQLRAAGIRADADHRSEKVGYKLREAKMQKIPLTLVVGDKEAEAGTVSVNSYKDGDLGVQPLPQLREKLTEEISQRGEHYDTGKN
ncbi:MAG: threonine--tRNA ligase [Oscillospiraceae bacterium]|jgi:threonyl-tRNA synthetase|nr:threonine--tRNA ligase [Oscillospiraceae bacterium]